MRDQQLDGQWLPPSDEEIRAAKAVEEYFATCEAFDRSISPPDGVPRYATDLGRMQSHARLVREIVMEKYGIDRLVFQKAIQRDDYRRRRV